MKRGECIYLTEHRIEIYMGECGHLWNPEDISQCPTCLVKEYYPYKEFFDNLKDYDLKSIESTINTLTIVMEATRINSTPGHLLLTQMYELYSS